MVRNRESLCVLKAQGYALTLNTLRFASEIRSTDELRLPVNEKLSPSEVSLARKLIEGMTGKFDPGTYHDTNTEDAKKLIDDKAKGQKGQAPPPKAYPPNVIDLSAALKESLAQKSPESAVLPDASPMARPLVAAQAIHIIRKGQAYGSAPAARYSLLHRFILCLFSAVPAKFCERYHKTSPQLQSCNTTIRAMPSGNFVAILQAKARRLLAEGHAA